MKLIDSMLFAETGRSARFGLKDCVAARRQKQWRRPTPRCRDNCTYPRAAVNAQSTAVLRIDAGGMVNHAGIRRPSRGVGRRNAALLHQRWWQPSRVGEILSSERYGIKDVIGAGVNGGARARFQAYRCIGVARCDLVLDGAGHQASMPSLNSSVAFVEPAGAGHVMRCGECSSTWPLADADHQAVVDIKPGCCATRALTRLLRDVVTIDGCPVAAVAAGDGACPSSSNARPQAIDRIAQLRSAAKPSDADWRCQSAPARLRLSASRGLVAWRRVAQAVVQQPVDDATGDSNVSSLSSGPGS